MKSKWGFHWCATCGWVLWCAHLEKQYHAARKERDDG